MSVALQPSISQVPLLTHTGERSTKKTTRVRGIDGTVVAELSLAPPLLISQTVVAQQAAHPLAEEERRLRLEHAADFFVRERLAGLTFDEHLELVIQVSGHGRIVAEEATRAVATAIAEAPKRAERGRPIGSVPSWRLAADGQGHGVWTRRGRTLAAILSGNSPTIQNGWLQALSLGYRVAVRPSRREPFTALRTIAALRAAGFRDVDAVFLPSDHEGTATLLQRADLGFVYGGDDIVRRYEGSASVKVAGPGRSKTLLGGDITERALEDLADSVSSGSGAGCVNTTAVFVNGDHQDVAARLAAGLTQRAKLLRAAGEHLGPRVTVETGEKWRSFLAARVSAREAVTSLDSVTQEHRLGGVELGPAVFVVDSAHDPRLRLELPFPCVWVAPWAPSDGIAPLRDSLVVSAITDDHELIDELLNDPTVRNVYWGAKTTHSDGMLPHEDFVGDFLMRNKAVVAR